MHLFFLALWIVALTSCKPENVGATQSLPPMTEVSLGIVAYNYTNRYIDAFEVDGNIGGNVFVSSPTGGGGGTTCCMPYFPGVTRMTVAVKWQSGGCKYHYTSTTGNDADLIHHFFKTAEIEVEPPFPADAKYLEVHFYPDGGVKAAISAHVSAPRLKLKPSREDKTPYPRCPHDKQPEA